MVLTGMTQLTWILAFARMTRLNNPGLPHGFAARNDGNNKGRSQTETLWDDKKDTLTFSPLPCQGEEKRSKKRSLLCQTTPGLGFEPRQRDPKSLVLPLHNPGMNYLGGFVEDEF